MRGVVAAKLKEKQPAIVSGLQSERSDISKDPSGEIRCASPASSLEHRVEQDEADEESVGASHIQLFHDGTQTDINPNAPPVNFEIYLPEGEEAEGALSSWEFVQIKFDNFKSTPARRVSMQIVWTTANTTFRSSDFRSMYKS